MQMPYCDFLKIYQWVEKTAISGGYKFYLVTEENFIFTCIREK